MEELGLAIFQEAESSVLNHHYDASPDLLDDDSDLDDEKDEDTDEQNAVDPEGARASVRLCCPPIMFLCDGLTWAL